MTHFLYLFSECSINARVNAERTSFRQLYSFNKTYNGDIIITLFIHCKLSAYLLKKKHVGTSSKLLL